LRRRGGLRLHGQTPQVTVPVALALRMPEFATSALLIDHAGPPPHRRDLPQWRARAGRTVDEL
jgi:hypothetical protein